MKISGTELAKKLFSDIERKVNKLEKNGIIPKMVIVKSSNAADVNNYIKQKANKGNKLGIAVELMDFDEKILKNLKKIKELIAAINRSPQIHGLIFQKPGDNRITDSIEKIIDPLKDIDGFLPDSAHEPPTYRGVKLVLRQIYKNNFPAKFKQLKFVIIGKGKTGGGPIIQGLLKNKISPQNIKIIDSKTGDQEKKSYIENADVVISAVGKANPVDYRYFSGRTNLIDIGVHFDKENKIKGDFAEEDIGERVKNYTTTPGGIGALTVVYLMDNLVNAAYKLNHL